jgi:rRNA maturation endonuclease Nob1
MRKNSGKFVNKIPTYKCLNCQRKNQQGNSCPYCGQKAKYVGLVTPFEKK